MDNNNTIPHSEEEGFIEEINIDVDPGQEQLRIDKYLLEKTFKISRTRIQEGLKVGTITVNGKNVKPNYKVRPLDKIKLLLAKQVESDAHLEPQEIALNIVYEDADVMVINKPAGLVVHPGIGNTSNTLVNGLMHYFQETNLPVASGNPDNRPGLVHRIDKDTTGLLVIAKTPWAMTHLAKQFYDHTVQRRYVAIVWGSLDPVQGTITGNITRDTSDRRRMTVSLEPEIGKHAVTHYRTLEDLYYVSLIECQLETGRTHQIRVHMKHQGHPLFNDERYGGSSIRKGTVFSKYKRFVENTFEVMPRQALHARTLGFDHPTTGERMHFECPIPEDFEGALTRWRDYLNSRKEILAKEL